MSEPQKSSPTVNNNHRPAAQVSNQDRIAEHFARLEEMLADLRHKVEASKPEPAAIPDQATRSQRAKAMLARDGSITASDVQLELGVSHATAMRTLHALAREKAGVMVLEQAGPTFRVRMWHPDRVILDHQAR